ncbi:MAG: ureidoglycolate lyase [Rhodobacteraceae bacterium]|jgi:ureidoglycolate lyase|nr:ureidoglycolate lyase [Paracoccaceae bacterium]
MHRLEAHRITQAAFARFGDLIAASGAAPDLLINQGRCGRFHDLAALDIIGGRAGISLFQSETFQPPFRIEMLERHPLGSQAFIPLNGTPYLLIVAEDRGGVPAEMRAFTVAGDQAVNIHRDIWHGVLTPIGEGTALYAVIDRIGEGRNLQEHWFDAPLDVTFPA